MTCQLCGGNAGRLNDDGVHNLCAARKAHGLPTPNLGTRCPDCDGKGVRIRVGREHGVMLPLDLGPAAIDRAIKAWAPTCQTCNGKGYTGGDR